MKELLRNPGKFLGFDRPSSRSLRGRQVGFVALLAAAIACVFLFVDLSPQVDESLFFSTSDPQFQEDVRIQELFRSQPQIFVSARADTISDEYVQKIGDLSRAIRELEAVESIRDILHGPESVEAAFENPLWSRLLVSEDGQATNVVIVLGTDENEEVISGLEQILESHESPGFELAVSGAPYVVEQMRRQVVRDLKVFGLAALLVFSLTVAIIYRSAWIIAGMVVAAAMATVLTLLGRSLLGLQVDILTPNITTIVFVLTILHMVFLTNHWNAAAEDEGGSSAEDPEGSTSRVADGSAGEEGGNAGSDRSRPVRVAVRRTLPPSFWAMLTTGLGFLSLLLAPAKPANNLGISGAIGAVFALLCAFVVYPVFLYSARPRRTTASRVGKHLRPIFRRKNHVAAIVLVAVALGCVPGVLRVDTDPQLFAYFDGQVRTGLERIDRAGGSSPLEVVIRDSEGRELGNDAAFERMWALQRDLEEDPSVGSVVSLPVLMAEAEEQTFFSFLLSWDFMLDRMEEPERDRIALGFLTEDRRAGRFILRMKESSLEQGTTRREAVERVERSIRDHGFEPALTGGLFALQAEMADMVSTSLFTGLLGLVGLFTVVAFVVSRSFAVGGAMVLGFGLIPLILLGFFGYLGLPLDVIALPAANMALAIGVDDMVHLVFRVREEADGDGRYGWDAWVRGRMELWPAIVSSSVVVVLGFGLLMLSGFPPTRRMGLAVLVGTVGSLGIVLVVFPWLASLLRKES